MLIFVKSQNWSSEIIFVVKIFVAKNAHVDLIALYDLTDFIHNLKFSRLENFVSQVNLENNEN